MKIRIVSPDSRGVLDGTNKRQLLDFLPIGEPADVTVVPIAYWPDYQFNPELWNIKGPVVLIDYVEFGWDSVGENRFGTQAIHAFPHLNTPEWQKFDDWVHGAQPVLTFKRELQLIHRTDTMLPIEYLCYLPIPPIQSKAEFEARPFEVCNIFGYSSPSRIYLHSDIIRGMADKGLDVITDWSQLEGMPPAKRRWVSILSMWWARKPISKVMEIQHQSKISVSLGGAGFKSFRTSEAPVGAIMAMPVNSLSWSYTWDESNSIQLPRSCSNSVDCLLSQLSDASDLYEKYIKSQENISRYECAKYVENYVLKAISSVI